MISRRSRTLQSPKYLQKKRKKAIITAILCCICFVLFVASTIFIFRLSFFQITSIKFENPGTLSASELERKILAVTDGSYFHVIPRSNIFFYPKKEIERAIMDTYKKISAMHISRINLTALGIATTERIPKAIACEGFREEEQNGTCFFVDGDGYVFSESPNFSDGVYPRYYVNSDLNKLNAGTYFLDTLKFKELQRLVESVRLSGIVPLGILIGDSGSYELYIRNVDQSIAVVYFDDRTPFEKTVSNLAAFWDSKKENFNYINLRFGNNVFYSLK